jgi:Ca-activated chloride channel homolog
VSTLIENFHLLRPWALILLLPGTMLWWVGYQAADTTRRWRGVIDADLLKHLLIERGMRTRWLSMQGVLMLAWVIAILASAGPTWKREPSPFAEQMAPTMIVLRVAPSMETPDLAPTRLERARQKITDLLKQRDGMPSGLIAYSGSAHLVLPPTADGNVVIDMAKALSTAIMPRDGDNLPDAIALATVVLRDSGQGGSILVIADTVAPGQTAALRQLTGYPGIQFLAMAPPDAIDADTSLAEAVSALDAKQIATTVDGADIRSIARRLDNARGPPVANEAERWREAGYWLTPLIALVVLLWFRRGWVITA